MEVFLIKIPLSLWLEKLDPHSFPPRDFEVMRIFKEEYQPSGWLEGEKEEVFSIIWKKKIFLLSHKKRLCELLSKVFIYSAFLRGFHKDIWSKISSLFK